MKGGSMTGKNKRGLSTIIATLLIILLTLVSVGIIWVVIRNVVQGGTQQIDVSQKCIAVELSAVTVLETSPGSGVYDVTLRRGADSQGDLGVKVNLFSAANNSGLQEFGAFGELDALGTITRSVPTNTTLANAEKVEFTAYFRDASGNDQLCSQTNTFNF